MTRIPVTPTTNPDAIRRHLTGASLGLFDMLLRAGPIPVATLFEGLNSCDTPATPREQRRRIGRYANRFNARLARSGWVVVRIGRSSYELRRLELPGTDAELHRGVAYIETTAAEGVIPASPRARKLGRDFVALCAIRAMTVEGVYARGRLRNLPEFGFHLDQKRLRRADIRDVGVFL